MVFSDIDPRVKFAQCANCYTIYLRNVEKPIEITYKKVYNNSVSHGMHTAFGKVR